MKIYCKTSTGSIHAVDYEPADDKSGFCSEIHAALLEKGVRREELPNLIMSSIPFPPEAGYLLKYKAGQMPQNPLVPEPDSVNSRLPERSEYLEISKVPWSPAYVHIGHEKVSCTFSDARRMNKLTPELPDEGTLRLVYSRCWKKLYQITLDQGVRFHEKITHKLGWSKSTTAEVSPSLGLSKKGFTLGISGKFNHTFSESEETSVERQFDHDAPAEGTRCVYVIWQAFDVIQSLQPGQEIGKEIVNKGSALLDSRISIGPPRPQEYKWGFLIECPLEEYQVRSNSFSM